MILEAIQTRTEKSKRSILGFQAGLLTLMSAPVMAQFSPAQDGAFSVIVGRPAGELNLVIAGLIAAIIALGLGGIAFAGYGRWASGRLAIGTLASTLLRASALIVIATIFLR